MRQLVPFVLSEELSKVKEEISSKNISDGTTHVAEAFVLNVCLLLTIGK